MEPLFRAPFRQVRLRRLPRFALILAAIWSLGANDVNCIAKAAELEATSTSDSQLTYRRVFVPADRLDAWPRDSEKYLPVEIRDFETWVQSADRVAIDRLSMATIDVAEYTATLDDNGRLHGRGQWKISCRGSGRAFVPLPDPLLSIHEPRWQSAAQEPVRIGLWGARDDAPKLFGLQVARSGTLEFDWSMQSQDASGGISIPWRMPNAITSKVTLDTPDGRAPSIDGGVLVSSTTLEGSPTGGKPRKKWLFAVSPSADAKLRIDALTNDARAFARQPALRETIEYRIEQGGLEIAAAWRLDGDLREVRELVVPLPRGAQLTSVAAAGQELSWQIARGENAPEKAVVSLPNSGERDHLEVVARLWHPLVMDRPWQLPQFRPENVFWSAGDFELIIANQYQLRALNTQSCEQTGRVTVSTDGTGPEAYSFSAHSNAGSLEVSIESRRAVADVRMGSSLVLADPEVTGRLVTEWKVPTSSQHRLVGTVTDGWNIETVETIPADAMAEWFIDSRDSGRQLEVLLTEAPSPTRNVTVIVMGRLPVWNLAAPIMADTLRIVNWSGARVTQHLLAFQSTEPYTAESVGQMPIVSSDSLSEDERTLLDSSANDRQVVDLRHAAQDAALRLTLKRSQFTAALTLDAALSNNELLADYDVSIAPQSNSVDRVLIHSTAPLGSSARWIEKSTGTPVAAERLPADDPQRKRAPETGELWRVQLPQPTTSAVEITVTATIPWTNRATVPLLALPDAAQQLGRINLRATPGSSIAVEPSGVTAAPTPRNNDSQQTGETSRPIRAAFHYTPSDCLDVSRQPKLWISPTTESGAQPLIVRDLELESFYWPDGQAKHRAVLQIRSQGPTEFVPVLPQNARLDSVNVDGQAIQLTTTADHRSAPTVRLPIRSADSAVSLCFSTQEAPLSAGRSISPPLATNGLPVLAGRWKVGLPEEYSARVSAGAGSGDLNWSERLFGPLARARGSSWFDPLSSTAWTRAVNDLLDWSSAQRPDEVAKAAATLPGWRIHSAAFVADAEQSITILHPSAVTTWGVVVLLVAFLGGGLLVRKALAFIAAATIAALLALVLPAASAPLATGALWGLVLATLAGLPRRIMSTNRAAVTAQPRYAFIGLFALAATFGITRYVSAQELATGASEPVASTLPAIERVLFPVDAERRIVGSKCFVSERFLRELVNAPAEVVPADRQWVLLNASYAGEIATRETTSSARNWTFTFEIETLERGATIVLPLIRDEAAWQPTAMLDGVPVPIDWRENGRGCVVRIDQPGRYSLALFGLPKTSAVDNQNQVNLSIPPLPTAMLRLRAAMEKSRVTVAGAATVQAVDPESDAQSYVLGPVDRLAIAWTRAEAKAGADQGQTLTELKWLHVGPDGIELETKYIFEGGARRENVTLQYGAGWTPVGGPPSAENSSSAEESAKARMIEAQLSSVSQDRQEVTRRWRLQDAPIAGNLRLPTVESTSNSTAQRWFALSVDPSLECTLLENTTAAGTPNEFLAKWGDATKSASPQSVFANFDASHPWTVSVRPRTTESKVREALHVAIGTKAVRVCYQALVTPGGDDKFRFGVRIPPQLSIEDVDVKSAGQQIATRWSRDAEDRVNIFFSHNTKGDYRLTLTGAMPIDGGEHVSIPRVTSSASESAMELVQLYREDDVEVDLAGLTKAVESAAVEGELPPAQWLVRPLGAYRFDAIKAGAARLSVKASTPSLTGDAVTLLSREAGSWFATWRAQLNVESGDLDSLQLRVPTKWSGTFSVESKTPATPTLTPIDESQQLVTIRFSAPVKKGVTVDLSLRAPIATQAGAVASVPSVATVPPIRGRRFISVPAHLELQSVAWTETGVRLATVPAALLPTNFDATKQRQLEIVADAYQVTIQPQASSRANPRVRLADTTIAVGRSGNQLVHTRLYVATDGLTDGMLRLPADQHLVSVNIDGRAALASRVDQLNWRLMLGSARLPNVIEIISRSTRRDADRGPLEFRRPAFLVSSQPVPVDVSLWTLSTPTWMAVRKVNSAAGISAADQATLRFDQLLSIAEKAMAAAADSPDPDGANWCRPWMTMLTSMDAQTRQSAPQSSKSSAAKVTDASTEQLERISQRFQTWRREAERQFPAVAEDSNHHDKGTKEGLVTTIGLPSDQPIACFVAEGGADSLAVDALDPTAGRNSQLAAITMVVATAVVCGWAVRTRAIADFLCRWPQILGVAIGTVFWACLWPSWLGLVIIVASVWLALRSTWPGRTLRAEASTILRSTRGI